MTTNIKSKLAGVLLAAGSTYVAQAGAQIESTIGVDKLEEITITAERREENLQKTSIAITAVDGDKISQQGQSTSEDILASVPGVVVEGTARGVTVSIRGLGADLPPQVGEGSVSTNFDGVYNFRSESGTYGYYDLARVEILRGPQGTLYGRNATGGVMNVISNNPSQQLEAKGSVQVGNYNLLRTEGMVNVPLSDNWAARAALVSVNRDGYLSDGHNDAVGQGARLKTLYKPSDDFSLLLSGEYAKIGGHGPGTVTLVNYNAGNQLTGTDPIENSTNYYRTYRLQAQLDFQAGPGIVTFIPAYQHANGYNWSAAMGGVATKSVDPIFAKQTSAELRYASDSTSKLKWVGGVYLYNKDDSGQAFPSVGVLGNSTRSKAVFGQVTYPLLDSVRVIGGVRESWDKKGFTTSTNTPPASSDSRSAFDWKVGLEEDLASASMLYQTVATGHRPGGFNVIANSSATLTTPGQFYAAESLLSYELGSKNRFIEDRLQVNGSVFYYDYKNYQLADIYQFAPVLAAQFVNADARIKGAELETQSLLWSGARLDLSATYLDSKLTQGVTRGGVAVFKPGDILSHSPKYAVKAGLQQDFDFGASGILTARGDFSYTGDQYVNAVNNAANLQKAHSTGDVSLSYAASDKKVSVNLYCKNVNNEVVKLFLAGNTPQVSSPRTYGVVLQGKL